MLWVSSGSSVIVSQEDVRPKGAEEVQPAKDNDGEKLESDH